MGKERFLFVPSPLPCGCALWVCPVGVPCGCALWTPDLTDRKIWRYSPECVEDEFREVHLQDRA
jgi:hypothetical protein